MGNDVRMVQGGRDTRLLEEPRAKDIVGREFGGEHLQRHDAAEARALGLIDDAHPAAAEYGSQLIARQFLPDHRQ